jgi:2-oxo-3-hexenedioate decarboxylase
VSSLRPSELARELIAAYSSRQIVALPSGRDPAFDLTAAYAVENEIARLRRADGRAAVGRKVGYANKAIWRALRLETLVWAHMYDDTVRYADGNEATLAIDHMCSPKIEPEIVFKVARPIADPSDAANVLSSVEWVALGFEIIDSVFAQWKFQPADFVAARGLHAALIVGQPMPIAAAMIPTLAEQLATFTLQLSRNGEVVETGAGKNSLRSPVLCLGELASAIARRSPDEPLSAGELVSSGTLTESRAIAPGETWTATVDGIGLPVLRLRLV